MKRITVLLFIVIIAALSFGCSSGNEQSGNGSASNPGGSEGAGNPSNHAGGSQQSNEKVEVKFVVWQSGNADKLRQIQDDFNSKYDDIELTIEMQGGSYWDYLGAKTASNDLPDLFYLSAFEKVREYAENDLIADVSDLPFVSKLYEVMKDPVSYEGNIYGYPFGMSFLGVLYNQDLFEQAGIESAPKTLTQFEQAVAKLREAGITPWASALKTNFTAGHLYSAVVGSALYVNQESWIEQMNAGEASFEIDGADGIFQAFDIIKDNMNANPFDSDVNNGTKIFATGEAAMFHNGNWAISDVVKINPDIRVGLFPLPTSDKPDDSVLAVDAEGVIVVNKNSKNVDAAKKVLERLTDETDPRSYVSRTGEDGGGTPPMKTDQAVSMNGAEEEFFQYIDSGKTAPWLFQKYPSTTIWETSKQIIPGYFAGIASREDIINEMDTAWEKAVKR